MAHKMVVVEFANKVKKNGKRMTSLIEYSLQRGDETNEFIINDVKAIMFANGEPCARCFVIEK